MTRGDNMKLMSPQEAVEYLRSRGYKDPKVFDEDIRIAYKKRTGDGSWENGTASQNEWVMEEYGVCCYQNRSKNPSANHCPNCGTGINSTISWSRGKASDLGELVAVTTKKIPKPTEN